MTGARLQSCAWRLAAILAASVMVSFLLGLVAGTCAHAEPIYRELYVDDVCRAWSTFPTTSWANDTGQTLAIERVDLVAGGADSLVGEIGLWFTRQGARPAFLYSAPFTTYSPPAMPLIQRQEPSADARYTLAPGESVQLQADCGPVNVPHWRTFSYYGLAKVWLVPVVTP